MLLQCGFKRSWSAAPLALKRNWNECYCTLLNDWRYFSKAGTKYGPSCSFRRKEFPLSRNSKPKRIKKKKKNTGCISHLLQLHKKKTPDKQCFARHPRRLHCSNAIGFTLSRTWKAASTTELAHESPFDTPSEQRDPVAASQGRLVSRHYFDWGSEPGARWQGQRLR